MLNISKFVKDHTALCICTGGIAILGYLGYHAVRWIINKCNKTEKVDQVAQKNISSQSFNVPKSLINQVSNLEVSQDKITRGQGEYVVFHKLASGEKKELTRETFEEVYKIFNQYSPESIINRITEKEKAVEECSNRYELIKEKIKELDPSLEVIFVPRTLYELIFIRKCIKEDLKHKEICYFLDPSTHRITLKSFKGNQANYQEFLKENDIERAKRKCWHLCYFADAGDNEHASVKEVAYRLNQVIVKLLSPLNNCLTHQQLLEYADKEIEFLKAHYKERLCKDEKNDSLYSCVTPGPTINFGYESNRGSIKAMGIRNDNDAQIIRNAVTLDCSKIAQCSFLLYRGASFQKDLPFAWDNKDKAYSVSYGKGAFAGSLYDGGATSFYYMRNEENAYAIPVSFDQLNDSPFYIPPTNTVAQLFGDGEIFHGRTKAWKDFDVNEIGGMNLGTNGRRREHLRSNLTKDELISQFQEYKNKAIHLK